jgi:hypothetical protein
MANVATRTLVQHDFTNWPSPCGVNCSYVSIMHAPSLVCNTTSVGFAEDLARLYSNETLDLWTCQNLPTGCPWWQSGYMVNYVDEVPAGDSWSLKWPAGSAECGVRAPSTCWDNLTARVRSGTRAMRSTSATSIRNWVQQASRSSTKRSKTRSATPSSATEPQLA